MRVLIATDGSDYSFMAVEKTCKLVINPETSKIKILSVYEEMVRMAAEPLAISAEHIQELENLARLQSTEYTLKAKEIIKKFFPERELKISMNVIGGNPTEEILKEAEKWRADLIVVGSLGHGILSRFFLGSVSNEIVRQANCSVLVVRGELDKNRGYF